MKKQILTLLLLTIVVGGISISCKPKETLTEQDLALKWADMTLYITKNTPSNSPNYASRCLGYIGLTMYESFVHSDPTYTSLAGQLDSLAILPLPEKDKKYDWRLSLNAAQATILKNIYNQTSDLNKAKIDSLEKTFLEYYTEQNSDKALIDRSVSYGKSIAQTIFEWSKTDGGHRGYLRNFDKKMKYPSRLGSWQPPLYGQSFSHYPLQPHWGENRTFLAANHQISDPAIIPYDTLPNSAYYKQFLAVYQKEKTLTQEQKEAAIWWGDDPDETFTPPGHSYYLATLVIKKAKPSLMKCVETYAKVGIGVADAFTNCWKWKYKFFTERPNTFIPKYIDKFWESFWPDPPFPAFPSGHAIQAATTATILSSLYGEKFSFTDDAHVGRKRDELRNVDFKARHFESFWQVAEETANSRFYGGIHVPQDNAAGLEKGKEVAQNIIRLQWKK
ncbi:phosphoesterase PA-phosphatase related protein [Emticicia oligotrophica DSM 17448]|uniref:Phosphoesterase PA-phosphatase related protein n=1 Tax=Emticicia oligotrophica (strain DSM 17448 / CIP 109782 / MTCC 6937 / GPTSA100-15) TaxID=929562 RepID=A0ABM5MXL2_EMTOG|nr:vanadium-dependent haloperoxidase [Emticicia oligotrophica]AFK01886.1 phosphoesterase PA-phosphatase related protein [Emticicia oligotrophica DSM 17448]